MPAKSDVLHYVRVDSWDPAKPFPGTEETGAPPFAMTYRDAVALAASDIPAGTSPTFPASLFVHPEDEHERPFRASTRLCSADFFGMMDFPFRYGGGWDAQSDEAMEPVVVLDDETNQRLFGGRNSVGERFRVGDRELTVVGVLEPFQPFLRYWDMINNPISDPEELYMPFSLGIEMRLDNSGNDYGWGPGSGNSWEAYLASESCWVGLWVELEDDEQRERFESFVTAYVGEEKARGRFQRPMNNRITPVLDMLDERQVMPQEISALTMVSLLFLLLCVLNVIGLLMGKFLARAPETGARRAMGASRLKIFVQHIVECELIGLLGGGAGARARLADPLLGQPEPDGHRVPHGARDVPRLRRPLAGRRLRRRALSGLADQHAATGPLPEAGLTRRPTMHLGPIVRALFRNKSRSILVVAMTALTLAIVVNCVQMILAARSETLKISGFDEDNLVYLHLRPFGPEFQDPEHFAAARQEDLALLRAQPQVVSASATHFLPWRGGGSSWECKPLGSEAGFQRMQSYPAGPFVAETLDVEVVQGRALTQAELDQAEAVWLAGEKAMRAGAEAGSESDEEEEPEVVTNSVLITSALAELFWPDEPAAGQTLETPSPTYRMNVVGVIDPFYNPYGWPIEEYAVFYTGFRDSSAGMPYLVRVQPDPSGRDPAEAGTVAYLEELLLGREEGRTIVARTVPETRMVFFSRQKSLIEMLTMIICMMLVVTSIGIFGMTYFSVAQRTRQIGTRRALGARRLDILGHFLTENGIVTGAGLTLGLGLAYALNVALVTSVGAEKLDPLLVVLGLIGLFLVSLAAAAIPATRSMKIAPAIATRTV